MGFRSSCGHGWQAPSTTSTNQQACAELQPLWLAAMSRMPFGNGVSWLHPTSRLRSPQALSELERKGGSRAWWTSGIIRNLHSGAGVDLMLLGLVAQAIESIDDKLRAEASVVVAASAHRELVAEVITESLNGERIPPTIEHALISFLEHLRPADLGRSSSAESSHPANRLQVTAGYSLRAVDRIDSHTMAELERLYTSWRNMERMDEVRRSVIPGVGKRGRDSSLMLSARNDPNPFCST